MKFSEFFSSWLHDNYYAKGVDIGKKGDFYTSVSVGYLFGVLHANYFLKLLDKNFFTPYANIVEIGANEGYLMRDFVSGIFTLRPELLQTLKFHIIEPHEILRKKQRQMLESVGMDEKFTWHETFDDCKFDEAFFISNELFDSFAPELVDGDKMLFVDENFKLFWDRADENLLEICQIYKINKGEIPLSFAKFAASLQKSAKKLKFLSFDYGQWDFRGDFSLRIYEKHSVKSPFETPLGEIFGKCDMTYDVPFCFLSDEFGKFDLKMSNFCKQNVALIELFGLDDIGKIILEKADKNVFDNFTKQTKFLTSPSFLGERFKFIEFTKE
ncbi:MAG: SAM-dependent methyltransferase [Campylobacter sp.]|nr:SAM-dependent methyltransferase [Campylobacter sp.]